MKLVPQQIRVRMLSCWVLGASMAQLQLSDLLRGNRKVGEQEEMLRQDLLGWLVNFTTTFFTFWQCYSVRVKGNKNVAALLAMIENHWIGAQEAKERSILKSDICKYFSGQYNISSFERDKSNPQVSGVREKATQVSRSGLGLLFSMLSLLGLQLPCWESGRAEHGQQARFFWSQLSLCVLAWCVALAEMFCLFL